ncbi:MAG: GNAT family N-acetyltransferase [Oscillospiraceae bacterium]|nr:GNAT family N-acetyltransferase [Oscillospiraceae bacterium]
MADYTLREYRPGDIPALSFLWQDVFGDPLPFTAEFYAMLPEMGSAVAAELDGKLIGAAHVLSGFELVTKRKKAPVVGYIYAVMVSAEHRSLGIGKALTLEAAALAKRRGCAVISTLPADAPLYGWYHRLLGIECVLHRKRFELGCAPREQVMELSATEYMHWRETLLQRKNYLRPSQMTLEFARRFCKFFGGGLYACASGICTAELDGDTCLIKELIARDAEDCVTIAASVGHALGAKTVVYYLPAREGEAYIAAQPGSIPADCVWNLSFD